MFSAATEVATPAGWLNIADIGGAPVYGWGSPDEPPRLIEVGVVPRRRVLMKLVARSRACVETTPEHDLRIDSQMTGPQVMAHGEIARRMLESTSYNRKSIYSFPEAMPEVSDLVMPAVFRNDAARRLAAALPYLATVNPVGLHMKIPPELSSFLERRMLLRLFGDLGLVTNMDGQIDRPFLRVEMAPGESRDCPDIYLARYVTKSMRRVFNILFELGVGKDLSGEQRGWWHMMSAHLGIRACEEGGDLNILRHRRHSLRCPEGSDNRKRACYEVDTWGLPLLLTRNGGTSPILVPVR